MNIAALMLHVIKTGPRFFALRRGLFTVTLKLYKVRKRPIFEHEIEQGPPCIKTGGARAIAPARERGAGGAGGGL